MTLPALVDVNVLLPLLLPQHVAHAAAAAWLGQQPAGSIRFALPVQLGVLRLLSQPRVMGSAALAPEVALQTWASLVSALGMQELNAPQPGHSEVLASLVARRTPTPNLWTDAWLAALARTLGCEMVTFDAGFRSFQALSLRVLAV
jgi:toxin-antitoxin system PIN domain toxin